MPVTILKTSDGHLDNSERSKFHVMKTRMMVSDAPLLIHIHGGLVTASVGSENAGRLSKMGDFAYGAPPNYEQLYIIWRSGIVETISANWRELHRRDKLYRSLLGKLLQFTARKLGVGVDELLPGAESQGLDRAEIERRLSMEGDRPFEDLDAHLETRRPHVTAESETDIEAELARELARDPALIAAAQDLEAAIEPAAESLNIVGDETPGAESLARLDPGVAAELRARAAQANGAEGFGFSVLGSLVIHGARIGARVWRRFRSGRDHGPHATIVEEIVRELYGDHIGGAIWNSDEIGYFRSL